MSVEPRGGSLPTTSAHFHLAQRAVTTQASVPRYERVRLPASMCQVFEEGEEGDAFFVIRKGSASVSIEGKGHVATLVSRVCKSCRGVAVAASQSRRHGRSGVAA